MLSALKNFGITFAAGLLIFGLLAFSITHFAVDSFANVNDTGGQDKNESEQSDAVGSVQKADLSAIEGQSFTALLVGVDYLPDVLSDYGETFTDSYQKKAEMKLYSASTVPSALCTFKKPRTVSADAIVLFHVNREEQTFIIYSIPGDTRVLIDGSYERLGNLIQEKGMAFFLKKVTSLTGMNIDYHMVFTPKGFTNIMESLGKINFEVPCNMSYSDSTQNLNINISAGEQKLGGADMLKVLRYASYADGDVSRMVTIRSFITTMLSQMKTLTTEENAPALYSKLLAYIYTDMDAGAFASIADLVFCYDKFTCISETYPGSEITYDKEQFFEPDIVKATDFFKKYR